MIRSYLRWIFTPALCLFLTHLECPAENLSTLTNEHISLSVDLDAGGAITRLSSPKLGNVVNNHDLGRQIQMAYYSGPVPFITNGQSPKDHWKHLGWNPIQAGDDFGNGSKTTKHSNDGHQIHTRCIPLQWPLKNIPGECVFESWIHLEGHQVHARYRISNHRSDRTAYPPRAQELPAIYANANLHRVVSYTGDRPFTGQPITVIERAKNKPGWAEWNGTEFWSAALDENDRGLGVIRDSRSWFIGGFDGRPGPNDTRAASTAYIAGHEIETIDHDATHEFTVTLVLGTLTQIRESAAHLANKTRLPAWQFLGNRQGWHSRNTTDQNPSGSGVWTLKMESPDPQLVSPQTFWRAEDAPVLEIEATLATASNRCQIFLRPHGRTDFLNPIELLTKPDGTRQTYRVHLANHPDYHGGMLQIRIDPVPSGTPSDELRLHAVRLVPK
jgi:hypothetical protein